jgi:signal recognition particle subunit SRP54
MFENLTERLRLSFQVLRGQNKLTEANIAEALKTVKAALLEADVALSVVTSFLADVKQRILGEAILPTLNPGEAFIQKVQEALTQLMGKQQEPLELAVKPPAVLLVVGLQGVGKTTTVGKLAYWLKTQEKKSVLVSSVDIYRPAAIEQLESLASEVGVAYYAPKAKQSPQDIAAEALKMAHLQAQEVLILDTAGRLHVDEAMMEELKQLQAYCNPVETLLVVDGMMGQDAAIAAQTFNQQLSLTGIILSKMEGDARGGAALSVRFITQKPIKFMGVGEKIQALEPFYPDRIATRILGMGDIVSLVEEVKRHTDEKIIQKLSKKTKKGLGFTLQDFLEQLQQMQKLGSMRSVLDKLPGLSHVHKATAEQAMAPQSLRRMMAIIQAMTLQERHFPHLIQGSRKRRIAYGAGLPLQAVSRLMKQFEQMQKMTKRFSTPGKLQKLMQHLSL